MSIDPCTEKTGGGLRVKGIIESDGTNLYSTQYTYSPGILNGEVQYYWGNYQGKLFNGNTYNAERFFTTSLLPVSNNSEGGSVSYSNVTERQAGNGKIEYTFSNHDNRMDENSVSIDLQKSPYSPLSSRIMERGKLLESKIYKEGAVSPFRKDTYQYTILNNNPEYIRSVYLRRLALFGSYFVNAVEGSAYKIYIYPYNVTQKTEYFYDNSNTLQNEYSWTYDSYNQVASYINQNNSNNYKETFKYPYNYQDAIHTLMTGNNMVSPVIEKITTRGNNNVEIERIKTNYTDNVNITNGLILPSSVQSSFSGPGNLITDQTFNKYDAKGNILQVSGRDGLTVCYLWGYKNQYPIAEIKNATYSDVTNIISATDLNTIADKYEPTTNDFNTINNLRNLLPNAMVTTYAYKPLVGLLKVTDPSGKIATYEYDNFNRLKHIKDLNGNILESYDYHYQNQ